MSKRALWLSLFFSFVSLTPACGDSKDSKKDKEEETGKADKADKKSDGSAKAATSGSAVALPADTAKPSAPSQATAGAAAHLTKDCDIAGRLDFTKLLAYPPFKKEIVPILDEILALPAPKDEKFKRFQAFIKDNGLDYKTALADLVFCVQDLDAEPTFAVALAGSFKPETLVVAIDSARTQKKVPMIEIDGRKALSDEKFTFGQFADGTAGLAQKVDVFKAMNATGDAATSVYKLDMAQMLTAATRDGVIAKVLAKKPPKGKGAELLQLVTTARMNTDLAANKTVITIGCASAEDAGKLNAYLTVAKSELEKNPGAAPFPNADQLIKNTKLSTSGSEVTIEITQSAEQSEQAIKALAGELRKIKATL